MYLIFLAVYLGNLIVSLGNRKINELMIIFDISNYDKKINYQKLRELSKEISLYNLKKMNYKDFIPGYNLLKTSASLLDYFFHSSHYIEELDALFILDDMNNIEKYEYKKEPTKINLLKTLYKGYQRIDNACVLETYDVNGYISGKVYYEFDDDNIYIINTEGDFKKMTTSEIKEIIHDDNLGKLIDGLIEDEDISVDGELDEIEGEYQREKDILKNIRQNILNSKDYSDNKVKGRQKSIGKR